MSRHRYLTGENIHTAIRWTYSDSTAREAATGFVLNDLYKFALQLDDNSIWFLTNTTPTWERLGGGDDATAIHTDEANEISGLTLKATPVDNDIIVIEDSEAGYVKKKVLKSSLGGAAPVDSVNSQTGTVVLDSGDIATDTTNFNGILSTADTDVQKALDTIDNLTVSASPEGSDTQIQFNDAGSFNGDSGLTYDKTNNTVTLTGTTNDGSTNVLVVNDSDSTQQLKIDTDGVIKFANLPYYSSTKQISSSDGNSGINFVGSATSIMSSNVIRIRVEGGGIYLIGEINCRYNGTADRPTLRIGYSNSNGFYASSTDGTDTGLNITANSTQVTEFRATVVDFKVPIGLGTGAELTIATGALTITTSYHKIDTETDAATDDLDTINGGSIGMRLVIQAQDDARDVVVKHGTGNIYFNSGADYTLDTVNKVVELIYNGTNWCSTQ